MGVSATNTLDSAYSALQIAQAGMDITSQNVAGSSVDGFNRRTTNSIVSVMAPNSTLFANTAFSVEGFTRVTDQLLDQQLLQQKSKSSYTGALVQTTAGIDSLMMDPANSIGTALSAFFNATGTLASDAQNTTNIQSFAGSANDLAARINGFASTLDQLDASTRTSLSSALDQANTSADALAKINLAILASSAPGNNTPSADILDQRDRLLMQLQDTIGGVSIIGSDGTATFQVGGATLVSGEVANKLVNTDVSTSVYGVAIQSGDGANKSLSYLSFQGGPVKQYSDNTGVGTVSTSVNSNIVTGSGTTFTSLSAGQTLYDANGHALGIIAAIGSNTQITLTANATATTSSVAYHYFSQANGSTQGSSKTALTGGQAGAAFTILTDFIPKIRVQLNAFAATLARDTNSATNSTGGPITPIFGYKGTSGGGGISTTLPTPITDYWVYQNGKYSDVGASANGNANAKQLTLAQIIDMSNPGTSVYDASIAAAVNSLNAASFSSNISLGAQVTTDVDATAANSIEALRNTYSTPLTNMTNSVASSIATWKAQDKANISVQADLTNRKQSVSGVNLDEEAANLVKFQQLYGAASKVIQTSNQLFTNLISMLSMA